MLVSMKLCTFLYAHFMGNGYLLSLSSVLRCNLFYATVWTWQYGKPLFLYFAVLFVLTVVK